MFCVMLQERERLQAMMTHLHLNKKKVKTPLASNLAYLFLFRRKRGNSRSRERTASQTELQSLRLNTSQTCPNRWASAPLCPILDSPQVSEVWEVSLGPDPLALVSFPQEARAQVCRGPSGGGSLTRPRCLSPQVSHSKWSPVLEFVCLLWTARKKLSFS